MNTYQDCIWGAAYREDKAAEQLGITVETFCEYAYQLGIERRRMYGKQGSWYVVFELEGIADLIGLKDRNWNNPVRGFRLKVKIGEQSWSKSISILTPNS